MILSFIGSTVINIKLFLKMPKTVLHGYTHSSQGWRVVFYGDTVLLLFFIMQLYQSLLKI